MSTGVRLVCPLCGTGIADGAEPRAGTRCPGCDARLLGGAESVPEAAAAALVALGHAPQGAGVLAERLFTLAPDDPRGAQVAMTSDERPGFYRWWLLVRDAPEDPAALLGGLARP